jgi:formamidopyrimidine-DNA glycosylase
VHFNDIRHFGTLKFVNDPKAHKKKLATLGEDVFSDELTPELFATNVLKKPGRTIAEALMDQTVVAGCGNYIKAECLYRSGISPWRNVVDITADEYTRLCKDLKDVSAESYASQGASIRTYRTVDDTKGTTQFDFQIYSMKHCPKGHEVVSETTPEGRTSWWCHICQT